MLPSEFAEVAAYPSLRKLLQNQVDMQFEDLRTLMRLPLPEHGLTAGCNLSAAAILFNAIAGASVCFYNTSVEALTNRGDRGKRFTEVLTRYYPWGGETLSVADCVACLYESARNPLAHAFGLDSPSSVRFEVRLSKRSLTPDEIAQLEECADRPTWLPPTLLVDRKRSTGAIRVEVSVLTLFWGVHRMLHALLADREQAKSGEAVAQHFEIHWLTFVSDLGAPPPFEDS